MSRSPAFFVAAILLLSTTGCAQTLSAAEVEFVTPEPLPPAPAPPPPPTDIEKAGLLDVVTNAEPSRGEPVIDVEFRSHQPACESGVCTMHIWRDGLVSFEKAREKKTGWSRVKRTDVVRWLADAEQITPSPKTTRDRMQRCRHYRRGNYAEVTFHLADRRTTAKSNDPCNTDRTDDLLTELSTAAPVSEGH